LESDISHSETIRTTLATLPEEQRQVVVLRHLVELAPRESPTAWVRPWARFMVFTHRGRRALQREVARLESNPCTRVVRHLTAV
jgi:RNA polymerase sigma-70 factor (ECF subfamily)